MRLVAARLQGQFIATRPVAERSRQKRFCCVTTRCHNLGVGGRLRRRWGTLPARTLGLGVLGFDLLILTPSSLTPRRLPALHLPSAFGLLAVTLVPTPRLVSAPATFAQADPRTRSTATGTAAALWFTMVATHGSAFSQGTARGERTTVLLGRLSKPGIRRSLASILPGSN
jgi:hypothetical protein